MRKTIILFALLFSLFGYSQAPIVDYDARTSSYVDHATNVLGTPTDVSFADVRGKAYDFNGTTSKIAIPEQTYDVDGGTYTFEIWCKKSSIVDNKGIIAGWTINATQSNIRVQDNGYLVIESVVASDEANCIMPVVDLNWHHYIFTCNGGIVSMYLDNVSLTMNDNTIGNDIVLSMLGGAFIPLFKGYIQKVRIYDYVLSSQQRNDNFQEFNRDIQLIEHPQLTTVKMARDLSYIPNLEFSTNFLPINGQLIDESGNGNNGDIFGAISTKEGMRFDGVDDKITTGIANSDVLGSVNFRFKTSSSARMAICGGFIENACIYINGGVIGTGLDNTAGTSTSVGTFADGLWHSVTVIKIGTDDYTFYVDGLDVSGGVNGGYRLSVKKVIGCTDATGGTYSLFFDGELADLQSYNSQLTIEDHKAYHNQFKTAEKIDLKWASVGAVPSYFRLGTGSYAISETVSSTPPLDFGNHFKSLTCTGAGTISYQVQQGITDSTYIEHLYYYNSSWSDVGGYTIYRVANDNSWFSYSGNMITFDLTVGQKFGGMVLQNQKRVN